MKKETENKQQIFSFKKGHTLPMSDEYLDFLENCQKALLIGNLRGMIVDNNDDGKPSFFQTTGIGDKKAKMALTFYKRFSDINKFTHFLVHEDDVQYYKDFIENFALENCQIITHRLRGKSTEYKIAFVPPVVSRDFKSSFNIRNEYLQDMETLVKFEVGSDEQDKQIKYMLQKYVAICLNYTDGKLNEVYTDHGNITVIVYKDNKMFTNVYSKVNKLTGEKIEFRDFDNIPKMFNARINGFKGKKTMTYDFILMNPPYDGNLHLKIVEQSIPMLTDKGILVNLSPIRWLQDPLAEYKNKGVDWNKFKEVRERIAALDVVSKNDVFQLFNIVNSEDLGIYYITKEGNWQGFNTRLLCKKCYDKIKDNLCKIDHNKKDGWRIRVCIITNSNHRTGGLNNLGKLIIFEDGMKDGKPWYDFYGRNKWSKTTPEITDSIGFDTEEEAKNFIDSVENTKFGRWYEGHIITDIHISNKNILWLPTYKHKWTDEQLYEYFNLTPEEVKLIESND